MELPTNTSVSYLNGTLYTHPELIFFSVGFSILIVLAIIGNSLVLVAVARTKKLQNVTNVFVVNLSLTDCLSSFGFLWSVPGMASTTPGYLLESDVPCVAAAGLVFTAEGCSVYTLANIALNRCILITRSKETYQWLYTPKKIALMVLVSWLIPFCGIVVPPLSGVGDLGFDPESRTCSDVDTHPRAAVYDKVQFAVLYPAPLLVIIVSYILIWRHVKRHFRNRRNNTSNLQSLKPLKSDSTPKPDASHTNVSSSQKPGEASPRHSGSSHHLSRMRNEQFAITKNLFVVVFAFVVCFTPIFTMVVTKSNRYHLYGALFLFASGCINPIIYAAKHPHFRPVLRSMVRCRCSRE
ncbi:G-protein coupled receptor moody-like [Patiria miniata]|uniref:G-protein coupled receptors family 1 profile domain-containing protein n=1 Tax=Patiria miniata TaxID=46514 RepID=A0A914AFY2_PATMI|nr:G-protein coupled receptor moody-like [Patiria miniata]